MYCMYRVFAEMISIQYVTYNLPALRHHEKLSQMQAHFCGDYIEKRAHSATAFEMSALQFQQTAQLQQIDLL